MNSPRLPLIADKELFRIWYEFYRCALNSQDPKILRELKKSAKFYMDWGADPSLHFDDWWITHRQLFVDNQRVHLAEHLEVFGQNWVMVAVPKHKAETVLVCEFRDLIRSGAGGLGKTKRHQVIGHRYAPTEVQGVKREALRMMLALQQRIFSQNKLRGEKLLMRVLQFFSSERYKRRANRIPATFVIAPGTSRGDHHEEAMRNVRRYRQKAAMLMLNAASGVFPGRY